MRSSKLPINRSASPNPQAMSPYLLAETISDFVKILSLQKCCGAPSPHPLFIEFVVMEGKDGLDVFPRLFLRSDASSTLFPRVCNHLVDNTKTLCLGQWMFCYRGVSFSIRLSCTNSVEPVLDPALMISTTTRHSIYWHPNLDL